MYNYVSSQLDPIRLLTPALNFAPPGFSPYQHAAALGEWGAGETVGTWKIGNMVSVYYK